MLANCTCCANQNTHEVMREGLDKLYKQPNAKNTERRDKSEIT